MKTLRTQKQLERDAWRGKMLGAYRSAAHCFRSAKASMQSARRLKANMHTPYPDNPRAVDAGIAMHVRFARGDVRRGLLHRSRAEWLRREWEKRK
jgi:hypothetical protein